MAVLISRNVIENIKDELRNQVRLWNYQLKLDSEINGNCNSSIADTLEKSKIIQKLRLGHIDKLLDRFETANKYKEDIINEIHDYWTVILPDIRNTLNAFHKLNVERKFGDEIEKLEIPERLNLPSEIPPESQFTSDSIHDKAATSQSLSRRKSTYSSFSTITTSTSRSRARQQVKPKSFRR